MRKTDRSRGEVADTIERFVDGICGKWEWDDFISFEIVNPQLEAIRIRSAGLSQPDLFDLRGKVAFIPGGYGGIGEAVAHGGTPGGTWGGPGDPHAGTLTLTRRESPECDTSFFREQF